MVRRLVERSLMLTFFVFPGSVFFIFLFPILFGEHGVYKNGISFRMYHVYFDEINEKFIRAIKILNPESLAEFWKPTKKWILLGAALIALMLIFAFIFDKLGKRRDYKPLIGEEHLKRVK
ncbi:MAG: hypothetical protein QXV01_10175 [Candidatus Bathyarchaeia archaeon]